MNRRQKKKKGLLLVDRHGYSWDLKFEGVDYKFSNNYIKIMPNDLDVEVKFQ